MATTWQEFRLLWNCSIWQWVNLFLSSWVCFWEVIVLAAIWDYLKIRNHCIWNAEHFWATMNLLFCGYWNHVLRLSILWLIHNGCWWAAELWNPKQLKQAISQNSWKRTIFCFGKQGLGNFRLPSADYFKF